MLFVLPQYRDSDFPFGIFKLFFLLIKLLMMGIRVNKPILTVVRENQPIDGGRSCASANWWWKFVWFENLMLEVRVVRQIDGGSSCGSTNWWWNFLFYKLMFICFILHVCMECCCFVFYFTCVYVMLLFRVLFYMCVWNVVVSCIFYMCVCNVVVSYFILHVCM